MKGLTRKFMFSSISLFSTSALIGGFSVSLEPRSFFMASALFAVFFFFIAPIVKLILLPLNFLTMGFASTIAYMALFHYVVSVSNMISVQNWVFPGATINSITIPTVHLSYWSTLIVSVVTYSTIISLLDRIV